MIGYVFHPRESFSNFLWVSPQVLWIFWVYPVFSQYQAAILAVHIIPHGSLLCSVWGSNTDFGFIAQVGPSHQQYLGQNFREDSFDPGAHAVCGGSPEVYTQRVDGEKDGQSHYNHGEQEVFPNEWDDKGCRRIDVGQKQEEDGQCQEDRDGECDLLSAVWRQVEHQYRQAGYGQTRHNQVQGVEQSPSAEGDVEGDVWVGLRAARVELLLPAGRDVNDVPFHILVEVLEVDSPVDHFLLGVLVEHGLRVTQVLQVHLVTVIRPRTKLHEALLHVKGEILHIDRTVGFVDNGRLPDDFSSMIHCCFCLESDNKVAICAERFKIPDSVCILTWCIRMVTTKLSLNETESVSVNTTILG